MTNIITFPGRPRVTTATRRAAPTQNQTTTPVEQVIDRAHETRDLREIVERHGFKVGSPVAHVAYPWWDGRITAFDHHDGKARAFVELRGVSGVSTIPVPVEHLCDRFPTP